MFRRIKKSNFYIEHQTDIVLFLFAFVIAIMVLVGGLVKCNEEYKGGEIEYGETIAHWEKWEIAHVSTQDIETKPVYRDYYTYDVNGKEYEAYKDISLVFEKERDLGLYTGDDIPVYYNPQKNHVYTFKAQDLKQAQKRVYTISLLAFVILFVPLKLFFILMKFIFKVLNISIDKIMGDK